MIHSNTWPYSLTISEPEGKEVTKIVQCLESNNLMNYWIRSSISWNLLRSSNQTSTAGICAETNITAFTIVKNREREREKWSKYQVIKLLLSFFSLKVVSDSWWPHGLQNARLHYPSPSPRVCSNLCPSSQWCQPTISSSVTCFSSHS